MSYFKLNLSENQLIALSIAVAAKKIDAQELESELVKGIFSSDDDSEKDSELRNIQENLEKLENLAKEIGRPSELQDLYDIIMK